MRFILVSICIWSISWGHDLRARFLLEWNIHKSSKKIILERYSFTGYFMLVCLTLYINMCTHCTPVGAQRCNNVAATLMRRHDIVPILCVLWRNAETTSYQRRCINVIIVETTLYQHRCNVMTLYRCWHDVLLTLVPACATLKERRIKIDAPSSKLLRRCLNVVFLLGCMHIYISGTLVQTDKFMLFDGWVPFKPVQQGVGMQRCY